MIIMTITVNVMNYFAIQQRPAHFLLGNNPMLVSAFSLNVAMLCSCTALSLLNVRCKCCGVMLQAFFRAAF